ncbi:hypothetical protein TIFTF001_017687 [Ficus carica]|uniref:Uncharacterized protein n=1 Tax=Ficus carica TaxID=3494 RepID=A0AA88D8K5_FICCA|nr:hypothetical protein TIFTF001_017687 [Ficus carica]
MILELTPRGKKLAAQHGFRKKTSREVGETGLGKVRGVRGSLGDPATHGSQPWRWYLLTEDAAVLVCGSGARIMSSRGSYGCRGGNNFEALYPWSGDFPATTHGGQW